MIIDVTGFGWSGSGAVHDLLREYDDVQFAAFDYDWEFTLLWECDGICDLEHKLFEKHCRFYDSNKAIKRFLQLTQAMNRVPMMYYKQVYNGKFPEICKRYINDLIDIEFEGITFDDLMFPNIKDRILLYYNKTLSRILRNHYVNHIIPAEFCQKLEYNLNHIIYLSYNPSKFLERTHEFLDELFSYVRKDRLLPLVTDQLFPPDNPSRYFKYVGEQSKCIVVKRDPRDTFLLTKVTYNSGIGYPSKSVDDFILFYKKIVEGSSANGKCSNILCLNFEDLIYQYDKTVNMIENFLEISQHTRKKTIFDPTISINNTQLFKKYKGYECDVKKIEKELPESIYDFSCFDDIIPEYDTKTF